MQNFTFHNPTKIIFGRDTISSLQAEIPPSARVLVTYGGGSAERNGVLKQVREALKAHTFFEFGGIEPNPTYETLIKAVALGRTQKIDFLLAVGGGSVIDGTKFIAAAIPFAGEPWDLLAKRVPVTQAVPLGCVLTLAATGSEMNSGAVISKAATKDKLVFRHPLLHPAFSVLDPSVTFSLPPRQTGNGIVDAFVHVLEQYLTYPAAAPVQDRMAEGLLLTLIEEGPKALATPSDYEARANLMWAATMALNGVIGQGVPHDWSTHALGHELTALYGLDHAQALAIILLPNLSLRRAAKREKLLQYAARVWNLDISAPEEAIDQALQKTRDFFESVGVPTTMKGHGLTCDVEVCLAQLARHDRTALGEKGDLTLTQARQIFESL